MSVAVQPKPSSEFDIFEFSPKIASAISAAGFETPRPVQAQTIPAALEGRDILGLAQTGTGKTAAFALPVLERLQAGRGDLPRALIVTPTRELARQVADEVRRLARFTRLKVAMVFGGVSTSRQIGELRRRPDIVVACPGRLLDLMQQGAAHLDDVEVLVLDEADHMFDMGFLPDVRRILAALPAKRQNLMFSATMPPDIRRLAGQILQRPHVVEISHSRPVETVDHALYAVESDEKVAVLQRFLAADDFSSAIVFTRTKHRARRLADQLDRAGHRAVSLQGNMSQGQRERAMDGFRRKKYDVMVATDIAARGIDVAGISHVVNFDMPGTLDAYTHRIGRTGRSERSGIAYTFVTNEERRAALQLERHIGSGVPWHRADGSLMASPSTPRTTQDKRSSGRPGAKGTGGRARAAGSTARSSAPNAGGRSRAKNAGGRSRPGENRSQPADARARRARRARQAKAAPGQRRRASH